MTEVTSQAAGRGARQAPPPHRQSRKGRKVRRLLVGFALLAVVLAVGAGVALDRVGVAPRALAPYVVKRSTGHNPTIVGIGEWLGATLTRLDRGDVPIVPPGLPLMAGAQPQPVGVDLHGGILVTTPDEVRAAVGKANAGDVITLAPGTYRFTGRAVDANRPGEAGAPIVVRAATPGTVHIEFDQVEGFRVSAPYWRFENLHIRGVCSEDSWCEHAFHVIGAGRHFAAVNNAIADFNAQFKINAFGDDFPDEGLIESNTLYNTRARDTANPVTPIDLVAANGWTIRGNLIQDFAKLQGNLVTYGAFAKGAGHANVFERNVVWCERNVRGQPGQRVGLSLGGGGTGAPFCRDRKCVMEQQDSTIRANLIASCSDAGIYLNSAAGSIVEDNTIVDTTGIDVRFPTSSARLDGNLVDGPIRSRNGGIVHEGANRTTSVWMAYVGYHPVRALFMAPLDGDFSWNGEAPVRDAVRKGTGLCGGTPMRTLGAFDDFSGCLRTRARR